MDDHSRIPAGLTPEHGQSYNYRPALMTATYEFHLGDDALEWQIGRRSGKIRYRSIRRVRLSFRPVTLSFHRFLAEIWSDDAPRLQIASTSWKSVAEHERKDAAYTAFVAELHRRMAAAGSDARFETGSPPLIYWPGLVLFVAVSLAFAFLVVRGLQAGSLAGAAFIAALLGVFLWQLGLFFRRNRPGRYQPQAVPAEVLPRA